ncbi:MAG: TIGR00730 family Rossman fold protein [Chloroflexota bacterium]|nr:TIGR00730 family Rossman fold protein [Chloroflexota bacterium]
MAEEISERLKGRIITVFCSSSSMVAPVYFQAAQELGQLMAQAGAGLVYGGTYIGLMGAVSRAVREGGSITIGVIPASLRQIGLADEHLTELIVTDGMRERKAQMELRGDAFIALPGGYGTLEEFFEIVTAKQLGFHSKAIVLLNTNGYYNPLLAQVKEAVEQEFMKPNSLELFYVAETPTEALGYIAHYQPEDYQQKWFKPPVIPTTEEGEVPGSE